MNGTQYGLLNLTLGNVDSKRSIYNGSFNNKMRINITSEEISEDNFTLCCKLRAIYA